MALTIAACAFGQQSPLAEGLVPYQFTFTNGEPTLYALVNEEDLDGVAIPVLVDEPWYKRAYYRTLQKQYVADKGPELSAPRGERLRRAWEAAGGVQLRDRNNKPYWVLQADVDKQTRASALVASAFPAPVEAEPVSEGVAQGLEEGSARGPGFVRLWWPHAAMLGGAVALIGALAWLTFRRSWSPI